MTMIAKKAAQATAQGMCPVQGQWIRITSKQASDKWGTCDTCKGVIHFGTVDSAGGFYRAQVAPHRFGESKEGATFTAPAGPAPAIMCPKQGQWIRVPESATDNPYIVCAHCNGKAHLSTIRNDGGILLAQLAPHEIPPTGAPVDPKLAKELEARAAVEDARPSVSDVGNFDE